MWRPKTGAGRRGATTPNFSRTTRPTSPLALPCPPTPTPHPTPHPPPTHTPHTHTPPTPTHHHHHPTHTSGPPSASCRGTATCWALAPCGACCRWLAQTWETRRAGGGLRRKSLRSLPGMGTSGCGVRAHRGISQGHVPPAPLSAPLPCPNLAPPWPPAPPQALSVLTMLRKICNHPCLHSPAAAEEGAALEGGGGQAEEQAEFDPDQSGG
mgnify:CR=1 FL=1